MQFLPEREKRKMTMYRYIMSSARAASRSDERRNFVTTSKRLDVGDSMVMDGILWFVDEILGKEEI